MHDLDAMQLARMIRAGEISSVEATLAQLDRIADLDPRLRSYAHVCWDTALDQARRADDDRARGIVHGPLHGVPIGLKDLFDTAGIPTASGMPLLRNHRPSRDATVVTRLGAAGAVLLGKHWMTEGAFAEHRNPAGPPVNPWDADRWCGASSSGSGVAVAAGLCFAAIGTDTGGSIRLPSAMNGVTGVKPTWGRVSRHGAFELAGSLDHVGPMTRSVRDAAAVLGIIARSDPMDPTASGVPVPDYLSGLDERLDGLRVGVDPRWAETGNDPEVTAALKHVVDTLVARGAELREIDFPDPTDVIADWFGVCAVQTALFHADLYADNSAQYGAGLSGLIEAGRTLSGLELQRLTQRRMAFSCRVAASFKGMDVFVIPAITRGNITLKMMTNAIDPTLVAGLHRFTCPFTMAGNPTVTLPGGIDRSGLPIAVQLVGRHFDEPTILKAGFAFQASTDWHLRRPPIDV